MSDGHVLRLCNLFYYLDYFMNEFTKEQLENILESLMETKLPVYEDLPSKVSFMIDNYCDHKNLTQDSALVDCCLDCNWVGFKDE